MPDSQRCAEGSARGLHHGQHRRAPRQSGGRARCRGFLREHGATSHVCVHVHRGPSFLTVLPRHLQTSQKMPRPPTPLKSNSLPAVGGLSRNLEEEPDRRIKGGTQRRCSLPETETDSDLRVAAGRMCACAPVREPNVFFVCGGWHGRGAAPVRRWCAAALPSFDWPLIGDMLGHSGTRATRVQACLPVRWSHGSTLAYPGAEPAKKLVDGSFVDENGRCYIERDGQRIYHDGEDGWDPSKPYQQVPAVRARLRHNFCSKVQVFSQCEKQVVHKSHGCTDVNDAAGF